MQKDSTEPTLDVTAWMGCGQWPYQIVGQDNIKKMKDNPLKHGEKYRAIGAVTGSLPGQVVIYWRNEHDKLVQVTGKSVHKNNYKIVDREVKVTKAS